MTKDDQKRLAEAFRRAHRGPPLLLLPNAWDAMSARLFEAAGFGAIATTSGGVAWALGFADGEHAPWSEVVEATARIVRTVRVPVTADIEAGLRRNARPGGQEHRRHHPDRRGRLQPGGRHARAPTSRSGRSMMRSHASAPRARPRTAAGVPLVINARIDLYLKNVGDPQTRFDETVRRSKAYLAAGADCIYPFALADMDTIARLVKAIGAPINIVARAGTPPVAEFERIGVARISIAAGASLAVMSLIQKHRPRSCATTGRFDALEHSINRADVQKLFAPRRLKGDLP